VQPRISRPDLKRRFLRDANGTILAPWPAKAETDWRQAFTLDYI
jgi:hypothetical protein